MRFTRIATLLLSAAVVSPAVPARPQPGPGSPRPLQVAAVQMRSSRALGENAAAIRGRRPTPSARAARVAVFPECALTGYFDGAVKAATAAALGSAERAVAGACREAGIYAVVGP